MNERQTNIKAVQDVIYRLPADQCEACNEVAEHIRRVIKQAGEPVGSLAIALVCAEVTYESPSASARRHNEKLSHGGDNEQ